jgi:hypothetical protein
MSVRTVVLTMATAVLAGAFGSSAAAQPLPPPEYGVRFDRPPLGSSIRRFAVKSEGFPVNRRYHELTEAERAMVHAPYERIEPGDEPPFPAEGLKPILEAIRKGQDRLLVTGLLTIVATVDQNGDVKSAKVLTSPNDEMAKFVGKLLFVTKFKPAVCAGQPCGMDYLLDLRFNVE